MIPYASPMNEVEYYNDIDSIQDMNKELKNFEKFAEKIEIKVKRSIKTSELS